MIKHSELKEGQTIWYTYIEPHEKPVYLGRVKSFDGARIKTVEAGTIIYIGQHPLKNNDNQHKTHRCGDRWDDSNSGVKL